MTIKQGDKVYLNSGSPVMVVKEVVGDQATCSWWGDLNDHDQYVDFDVACLTHTNPNPKEHV